MSTLTTTHSLGPVRATAPQAAAAFAGYLRTLLEALREGRDAAGAYERLTRMGVPHDRAVREVFDTHYRTH